MSSWSAYKSPVNIYEMRRRRAGTEDGSVLSTEIADLLIPYIKDMGYTHVESCCR